MARPGLRQHPKFLRLVHILGEPEAHVVGYLECLWSVAYENGDPFIGDAETVELAARYPGERGKLFKALLECGGSGRLGFIEKVPKSKGQFRIHDLFDHAPDYVPKRALRETERKKVKTCDACGTQYRSTQIHSKYCSETCRKMYWKNRPKGDGGVTEGDGGLRHPPSQVTEGDGPPAPAPAPAPAHKEEEGPQKLLERTPGINTASNANELAELWDFNCTSPGRRIDRRQLVLAFQSLIDSGWSVERIRLKILDPKRPKSETWNMFQVDLKKEREAGEQSQEFRILTEHDKRHGRFNLGATDPKDAFTFNCRTCDDLECTNPKCIAARADVGVEV